MHTSRSRIARLVACAAAVAALSSCESLLSLDGNPRLCARKPSSESLTDELVVLRVVENAGAPYERLVLDRVRYLEGDERHLNRVIFATTEKVRPEGQGLEGLRRGERLRVSTTYTSLVRGGGYEAYISNWVANEGQCWDGAWVSQHTLESVSRPNE